jgi:hypothetical protein
MRPHIFDREHNQRVGEAFRDFVGDMIREGFDSRLVDLQIGEKVNAIAQAAYDLGVGEVQPSQN